MADGAVENQPRFWVDGQPAEVVPVTDRGLQYGDGVFETIRVDSGHIPLWSWHCSRLENSCRRLNLPVGLRGVERQVYAFIDQCSTGGCGSGTLKIMITRGSGGRGYNPASAQGRVILGWFAPSVLPDERARRGVRVKICQTRLGHSPVLAGMKHLNRLEQVLARGEWQDTEYGEGLVFDITDRLIEGTMSNVFLVESGQITTPDLSLCGVDGVLRQWLLEHSVVCPIHISPVGRSQLQTADEVFIANSVMGVVPVTACEERRWLPGPITRSVQQEVFQLFNVHG